MPSFIEDLNEQKMERLLEWRRRYSADEYPVKIAQNLLYEALTIQKMWVELKRSFSTMNLGGKRQLFTSFDEAHNYIFVRRRQIQTHEILPFLPAAYRSTEAIPRLNFSSFRKRVDEARRGNQKTLEEIEFTYYFHTAAYEMVYAWAAAGLLGLDEGKAFHEIATGVLSGVDFDSMDSLIGAFGQLASILYQPLSSP